MLLLGPLYTGMCDHLWAGTPSYCVTSHPAELSLAIPRE